MHYCTSAGVKAGAAQKGGCRCPLRMQIFACKDTPDASSEWHPVENLGGMHWGSPSQIEASSQQATGFKGAGRTAWSLASIVARRGGDGSPAERLCRLHLLWQRQ